jgi:predicted dehydrogenase
MAVMVEGRRVRYAVVGGGWISQAAFMPGMAQTGNSELAAIVTGDPAKAQALGRLYGLRHSVGYGDFSRLIASGDIDAVYLAVPNHMHRDFAVPALQAGLHVLLEKPMATSLADCVAINAAAMASGAKLMIAYRLHFEPMTVDAIRRVRAGKIGAPILFDSVFTQHVAASNHRARSGFWAGPVADMGPYPINAARQLFAAEPEWAMASGVRTPGARFAFHDTVSVTLRFPGERLAHFTVSYAADPVDFYRVAGTQGDLLASPGFMFGAGGLKHTVTVQGKAKVREFPATDQFSAETQYFSDCVISGRDPECDGEEGLADVRVVEAVERALETGQPQTLAATTRSRWIAVDQAIELPPVKPPKLVNAASPDKG